MMKRMYTRLTEDDWQRAAEMNSRGMSYEEIADSLGTSVRSVAGHVPKAMQRRRAAIAASSDGTTATALSPSVAAASVPSVEDRMAATKHWRKTSFHDAQLLQARLRALVAEPAPDQKAIRSIQSACEALAILVKMQGALLGADKQEIDVHIPELVVREITQEEVAEIRRKQRNPKADLDDAEIAMIAEETDSCESEDTSIVSEE